MIIVSPEDHVLTFAKEPAYLMKEVDIPDQEAFEKVIEKLAAKVMGCPVTREDADDREDDPSELENRIREWLFGECNYTKFSVLEGGGVILHDENDGSPLLLTEDDAEFVMTALKGALQAKRAELDKLLGAI